MGGRNGCLHTGLLVPGDNSLLNGLENILLNRQDESLVLSFSFKCFLLVSVHIKYNMPFYLTTYSNRLGL